MKDCRIGGEVGSVPAPPRGAKKGARTKTAAAQGVDNAAGKRRGDVGRKKIRYVEVVGEGEVSRRVRVESLSVVIPWDELSKGMQYALIREVSYR